MLTEERRNVFDYAGRGVPLAHCIASDLRMGAGIAVEMQKRFGLRGKLSACGFGFKHPTCIFAGGVFNLITKAHSSGKPTYRSIEAAIDAMGTLASDLGITRIAMPRIGCGLDRLSWPVVRAMLVAMSERHGIDVIVCSLGKGGA